LDSLSGNLNIGTGACLLSLHIFVNQGGIGVEMQAVVNRQVVHNAQIFKFHVAFIFRHAFTPVVCVRGTTTSASPTVTFSPPWFCARHSMVMVVCPPATVIFFTRPLQVSVSPRRTIPTERTLRLASSACGSEVICREMYWPRKAMLSIP